MKFYNSVHNFYKGKSCEEIEKFNSENEITNLEVVKNEEFGFFVALKLDDEFSINLDKNLNLPWWGLDKNYRFEVVCEEDVITTSLVDYVKDDDKKYKADIILKEKSKIYENCVPVFVEGKIPADFKSNKLDMKFNLYSSNGFEAESLIESKDFTVKVIDFVYDENIENSFYLDLWQHPCSWARAHGLKYFSDEHFVVIENYLRELGKIGQKVINLVVSDFPWAGQMCFAVEKNKSRLYEYNIINVKKKNGELILDFTNLDRYINICKKYGIDKEINLFGLIGNWHGMDFGSPLKDYRDPIRVSFYDENKKVFDYIRTKEELRKYVSQIFEYFNEKGYLNNTKIIGDEPDSIEKFKEYSEFLNSSTEYKLSYKYALHSSEFLDNYSGSLESFSLNTLNIADYCENGEFFGKVRENLSDLTWYSCCFPEKLNFFIKSPLIESRLTGAYTYLFKMKGMLRWAYGIFVEDIFDDIRYKSEKWAAGDMNFVYPSKDMSVLKSIRERNMFYGIQDFNILRQLEKNNENIYDKYKKGMNIKKLISRNGENIELDQYSSYNYYMEFRNSLIKELT